MHGVGKEEKKQAEHERTPTARGCKKNVDKTEHERGVRIESRDGLVGGLNVTRSTFFFFLSVRKPGMV